MLDVYGARPVGILTYDSQGVMTVNVARRARRKFREASKFAGSPGECQDAMRGYEAYFAMYTVDEAQRTIVHSVRASLYPNWTGTDQVRLYRRISGGRLELRSPSWDADDGEPAVLVTWRRYARILGSG